jgi:site-specific DNA-cytosine methylase
VSECSPRWAVMENVREALPCAPSWDYVFLRDFDCGGYTHRRRGFWFYGVDAPPAPARRAGDAEYSVLASHWNRRGTNKLRSHMYLSPTEAARLQGFPALAEKIINGQPGWKKKDGNWNGVSATSREVLATHMCGNGVPKSMGTYIAQYMAYQLKGLLVGI